MRLWERTGEFCLEEEGHGEQQQSPVKAMAICLVFPYANHMEWTLITITSTSQDVCDHREEAKRKQENRSFLKIIWLLVVMCGFEP